MIIEGGEAKALRGAYRKAKHASRNRSHQQCFIPRAACLVLVAPTRCELNRHPVKSRMFWQPSIRLRVASAVGSVNVLAKTPCQSFASALSNYNQKIPAGQILPTVGAQAQALQNGAKENEHEGSPQALLLPARPRDPRL